MIKFNFGELIFRSKLKVYIQNHLIWDWVEKHNTRWLFFVDWILPWDKKGCSWWSNMKSWEYEIWQTD